MAIRRTVLSSLLAGAAAISLSPAFAANAAADPKATAEYYKPWTETLTAQMLSSEPKPISAESE